MKIFYLAHRIPYPPNKGDKIRSFNEIKYLSSNNEVHLACLADNPWDLAYANELKKYCQKVCVVQLKPLRARIRELASLLSNRPISVGHFYSKSLQATVNRWLFSNAYDAVICFSSPMAEYLFRSKAFKSKKPYASSLQPNAGRGKPRLVMDFCDVDSDKWLQYSGQTRFPLSFIYRIENKRLFEYERKINQLFDSSVFVSQAEATLFLRLFPEARNLTVIPNGVDCDYFSPEAMRHAPCAISRKTPVLLFTGAMDYYANVEGVLWFTNDIFPLLRKEFPQAQFYIVGSNPHPKVGDLEAMSGVKVTGFVDDIRPYYQAADICVIPLRLARGVQNKILEAMAMEKAVVTTGKAIQGIEAMSDKHVLVEDNPKDFARAVSKLLKDQQQRDRLGAEGRNLVIKKYDWQVSMENLEHLLYAPANA